MARAAESGRPWSSEVGERASGCMTCGRAETRARRGGARRRGDSLSLALAMNRYRDVAAVVGHLDAGRDVEEGTPLLRAVAHRRVEIVKTLLARGADPDARGLDKRSPLAVAARCAAPDDEDATARCAAIAAALVEYGADVDGLTENGWSPLFHAARARNVLMLETLLALDASEGLTERSNDEDVYSGRRRTYVDHARRFADPDDDECRLGAAAARRACGALRAWLAARAG